MPCIRIKQATIRQVEHTHEERHEHERVVALTHGAVDRLHDQFRRDIGHRRTAEHRARHRHHERCRHTLACHVADTEIEFIVADEEVEEVATHLLRRHHLTEDVDICALRERRIHLRQHALLDVAGDLEFLIHRHVRGRCLLQFLHIFRQGGLHLLEGIAQGIHLTALHLRQRDVEITFCRLSGSRHKARQRSHVLPDQVGTQQVDHQQTHEEHGQDDVCQETTLIVDDRLGHDDHHRPVGIFHIGIEHPAVQTVVVDVTGTALTVQHPLHHRIINGVRTLFYHILDLHLQHTLLHRMDQVGTVVIDDETIGLL